MDGQGASRLVWRLFSPSFRLISCTLEKNGGGYHLAVRCGTELMTSCEAADLEPLHARASEWRSQLEARGYRPADSVRASDAAPAARACESRAALLGILESAAVLELQQDGLARQLRDRATEGLVAVSLKDADYLAHTIVLCRAVLAEAAGAPGVDSCLISSCHTLLDRIGADSAPTRPKDVQ